MRSFFFITVATSYLVALEPFELHNISKAHDEDIRGTNVVVGIIDDAFRADHQGLTGKVLEAVYPYVNAAAGKTEYSPNFATDTHGSHVAGIVLGNKVSDTLPYGVAYEAKFYGMGIFAQGQAWQKPSSFDFFNPKNEVKIINNSWGSNIYPVVNLSSSTTNLKRDNTYNNAQAVINLIKNSDTTDGLYELATQKQVLALFAAGNEGILSPSIQAVAPAYDESLRSWLSIGALDSAHIEQRADGILVVSGLGIADFSNGFIGAENFSLVAAGVNINSVDSKDDSSYTLKNGTSMATPTVSGIAALISQQFPFLDGKQIADILLSTANKNYEAPKMTVKKVDNGTQTSTYTVVYIDQDVPADTTQIRADLMDLYNNDTQKVDEILNNFEPLQPNKRVSKEELFGQGIVDALKAIKGLSEIDINRLSDNDAREQDGIKEAFYTLDVGNFDATFENDISQKKWDDTLHRATALNKPTQLNDLNGGLIKGGTGKLTLMGANSYEGSTIIEAGELILEKRADDTGASLASRVFVEQDAKLNILGAKTQVNSPTQSASITNDLINNGGTVSIGERGLGLLSITGTYTQKNNGILQLSFNSLGNSKFEATSYTIENGELQYRPLEAQFSTTPQTIVIDLKQELKDSLNSFTNVSVLPSQALDYTLMANKFTLQIIGKADAYENFYGANPSLAAALRNIASLQNLPAEYSDYFNALNTASANEYQKSLKSIDSDGYLRHTKQMLDSLNKNALRNMLHLYDTSGEELWVFTPSYYYGTAGDYNGKGYAGTLSAKKEMYDGTLAGYLQYEFMNGDFDYSNVKSQILSGGVHSSSYLNDYVKLISGFNLGISSNKLERELYPNKTQSKASYQNVFASAQLGLAQDYQLFTMLDSNLMDSSVYLTPMVYLNYNLAYQEAFKENGDLFSKSYSDFNNHTISAATGLNLKYRLLNAYNYDNTDLNLYTVYERTLLGSVLRNHAYFNDFSDEKFKQKHKMNKDTVRVGVNLQYNFLNSFFSLGLDNQISKDEYNFNILGKAGMSF